ncbi:DUF4760 domain-containing protein [Cognatiluteimonas lumbrici]|uniref:DUF4760 domain-containing protein n=1 Tax=Cognatiluteimonas lumbrici TaxID=2559601 RepID=UPI001126A9A3|nr:DUF4760 domain-containing protein [Luteimonas lumbrici]
MWQFITSDEFRNFAVVVGVLVAIVSIFTARSLAQKKQAADMLFLSRGDPRLQSGARTLLNYHSAPNANVRALALPENRDKEEARDIRFLLNHFELVSNGIQCQIYDEAMVKRSWCTIVLQVHEQAQPFIQACREQAGSQTIYQEVEWLAKRWKKKKLKAK